jgi:hypothetical protein
LFVGDTWSCNHFDAREGHFRSSFLLKIVYFMQPGGRDAGRLGFFGFVLAVIGTAMITGPDGTLGGVQEYVVGALLLSAGIVFLAIGSWHAARLPRYVPVLWVISTVLGVGGFALSGPPVLLTIAGLAFGAGFIGAGIKIWLDPALRAR